MAKSKVEKSDTLFVVEEPFTLDVVEDVGAMVVDDSKVVVVVDVVFDVDPLVMIVAAPAAKMQRTDIPAPKMEPVILTGMFATPEVNPCRVSYEG
ncbi:hypothetical protein CAF53_00005 [Sphingobium sp. LB126]|uniref:Uncharacterized protein n=1 Tax=Sphingobium chungbukense TaxID=56193 RepID=A0A0M3ARI5_9SPHN|nr:hypothetical protein YP76_07840 [Sphingobium chungbukense]PJG46800.1 hypothetical protein CAF53_00005 [Sphingobium sp. LB126]